MLHFPVLRTRRLTLQLRELSIGDSMAIAEMPLHLEESATTAFLRKAIDTISGIDDPINWTVQERTMAVCHYLASVSDDGPDFSLGESGKYSDYLDGSVDAPATLERVEVGEIGGDLWFVRHLTGGMAESIERLSGVIDGISGKRHWLIGAMASQLVRKDEEIPNIADGEGAFDDFLVQRIKIITAFPESDFIILMSGYLAARTELHHLFRIDFAEDGGLIVLPTEGGAARGLPPARFPVRSCISKLAEELVGKSHEYGR